MNSTNRIVKLFKSSWTTVAVIILCLVALALSQASGASDIEESANHYCYMVYHGHWPDYQKNYWEYCEKDKWNGK